MAQCSFEIKYSIVKRFKQSEYPFKNEDFILELRSLFISTNSNNDSNNIDSSRYKIGLRIGKMVIKRFVARIGLTFK